MIHERSPINDVNVGVVFHGLLLLIAVFEVGHGFPDCWSVVMLTASQISLDSWLLAQYRHVGRFANVGSRDGIRLALFVQSLRRMLPSDIRM